MKQEKRMNIYDYYIFHDETDGSSKRNRQFAYLVKTNKEWEKLGFDLKLTALGYPSDIKNQNFSFEKILKAEPDIIVAIETGKRGTTNPLVVSCLYALGVKFDEFIPLPEAVKCYSEARLFQSKGDIISAYPCVQKVLTYKNENGYSDWECRYMELYFELGRKLLKKELLVEELNYLESNMDTFHYESWTETLLKLREYDMIDAMFVVLKDGINKLISYHDLNSG
jgi:hypothetical protein